MPNHVTMSTLIGKALKSLVLHILLISTISCAIFISLAILQKDQRIPRSVASPRLLSVLGIEAL